MVNGALMKGVLAVVLEFALLSGGYLLVFLGYGKKEMKARAFRGKKSFGMSLLWGFMLNIWLIFGVFFFFTVTSSSDKIRSLITLIGCPILYILWVIYARKSSVVKHGKWTVDAPVEQEETSGK